MNFRFRTFVAIILFLIVGVTATFLWFGWRSEKKIEGFLLKTKECENISEVISILGPPSYRREKSSPNLGQDLLGPDEDVSELAFYFFRIRRLPPTFIVVKTSLRDGTVISAGSFRS